MVRLECRTGGHNKFYEFHERRSNGRVVVVGFYGAIGQAPKEAVIYNGDNEAEAHTELQKKMNEKLRKGYEVVSGIAGNVAVPDSKKKTA